jgi:CRISPR-associated protein Cas1
VEAQAARCYWTALFGDDFRRNREEAGPNQFLNYGYGALRAIVGRAVTAAGLHPSIGIHHHHRANAYPLVDDLIEPFRPIVDLVVLARTRDESTCLILDRTAKRRLLTALTRPVHCEGETRTLFDVTQRMTTSLADYLRGNGTKWAPPVYDPEPLPAPDPLLAAEVEVDG